MSPQIAIVLVAVFVSIALAVGAGRVTRCSGGARRTAAKSASWPATLAGVFTNVELTEVPAPWVKHFQQVAPKSPKEMSKLRPTSHGRRLSEPDGGGAVWRR